MFKGTVIMLTNPISSNLPSLPALFTPPQDPGRQGHGDQDSGGGNSQGITVLASLLEALVQAASTPAAATSSGTATAGASTAASASTATGAAATTVASTATDASTATGATPSASTG